MVCNFCFSNSLYNKTNIFLGLIEYELNSPGGGGAHDIFGRGCATIKSLYRPFLEFLTKKLDPFRNFCAYWRSPKYDFEGCLGKKWFPFSKNFPKIVDFFVQTGSKKSINSVFFWFVICVIKITDPIWNFLQIL